MVYKIHLADFQKVYALLALSKISMVIVALINTKMIYLNSIEIEMISFAQEHPVIIRDLMECTD